MSLQNPLNSDNPQENKYFRDKRIRKVLIKAGLIDRNGEILPHASVQAKSDRYVKKNQTAKEESVHSRQKQDNDNRVRFASSARPARESKKTSQAPVQRLSDDGNLPLPQKSRTRSTKRAKSAHSPMRHSKQDASCSNSAKLPDKQRCEITMIYYGPSTNLDYDDSWVRPNGDEILVLQQHCGGENLTVFKGHVKPNQTFTFESRRHSGYPFALAFYVNGFINNRISVCCEYRHKRNTPLDGKYGLFGIANVRQVTPCESCQQKQSKKKIKKKPKAPKEESRYRQSFVSQLTSYSPLETQPDGELLTSLNASRMNQRRSPDVRRTPTPQSEVDQKKSASSPSPSSGRQSPIPPKNKEDEIPIDTNSNKKNEDSSHNDDDKYSSDFDEPNDVDAHRAPTRFGRPRISVSNSTDSQDDKNNKSESSSNISNGDDKQYQSKQVDENNFRRASPHNSARKSDTSDDDINHTSKRPTKRDNITISPRSSASERSKKSVSSPKSARKQQISFTNNTSQKLINNRAALSNSEDEQSQNLSARKTEGLTQLQNQNRKLSSPTDDFFGTSYSSSQGRKERTDSPSDFWSNTNTKTQTYNYDQTDAKPVTKSRSWLKDLGFDEDE